jgi:hypothetical protein
MIKTKQKLFYYIFILSIFFIIIFGNISFAFAKGCCMCQTGINTKGCAPASDNSISSCNQDCLPNPMVDGSFILDGICKNNICISETNLQTESQPTTPTPDPDQPKLVIPELQISIPGIVYSSADITCDGTGKDRTCQSNFIGKYIVGIYKYALGIIGIIAVIVMMIGGVMWIVAAGNTSRITEAKAWIGASITGLILMLSSYTILSIINPGLTSFKALGVKVTEEMEPEYIPQENPDVNIAIANADGRYRTLSGVQIPQYMASQLSQVAEKYNFIVTSGIRSAATQISMTGNSWACQCKDSPGCNRCPHVAGRAVDVWPTDSSGRQIATLAQCKSDMQMCHQRFSNFQAEMKKAGLCVIKKEAWHYEPCK